MSAPRPSAARTSPLARGLALVVAVGCFAAIAWSARERPAEPARPPAPATAQPALLPATPSRPAAAAVDACRARKEAEIEAIRAAGELTAERRMRIRQIEARACE